MSAWSGYRVELGQRARDRDLAEFQGGAQRRQAVGLGRPSTPVLDAERVELELSAIAALRGNVVISTARLVQADLYVRTLDRAVYAPTPPKAGASARARGARSWWSEPIRPSPTSAPAGRSFGTVEFSDGRIVDSHAARMPNWSPAWPARSNGRALNRTGKLSPPASGAARSVSMTLSSRQAAGPVCRRRGAAQPRH